MRMRLPHFAVAALLLAGCSSEASPTNGDSGVAGGGSESRDSGVGTSGEASTGVDAGGRVAHFDFGAVCTASWLAHDPAKPFRFAVELARGKLPNNEPSVTLWFTPLRATAVAVESRETIGPTLHVPEEAVGGYDFFDAILATPNDLLGIPADAAPDGQPVEMTGVAVYGRVPRSSDLCVWFSGALTKPRAQPDVQLHCLLRAPTSVPTANAEDFANCPCGGGSYPSW